MQAFQPDCSLPPPGTNYVSGPNTRSTLSILWNCLSIIFLCTWTIQHLNVPAIRPEVKGFWRKLWQHILDSKIKAKWMIMTILIPEYLVGRALGEWLAARDMTATTKWSMVEAYMANMGHFVLDVGETDGSPATAKEQNETPLDDSNTEQRAAPEVKLADSGPEVLVPLPPTAPTAPSFSASDAASAESESFRINLRRLKGRFWALNAAQWVTAVDQDIADSPGAGVHSSQLEKLDKSGALVKTLALIQVTYLVVQLIARKIIRLPSSQLEIAALAFAASSALTYALYWSRPQGVETFRFIKAKPRDRRRRFNFHEPELITRGVNASLETDRYQLAKRGPVYLWLGHRGNDVPKPDLGPIPIPNDAGHLVYDIGGFGSLLGHNDEAAVLAFGSVLGGALFGGLHCLAWNFEFPTGAEQVIWRVCAILTTTLPVVAVVPLTVWIQLNPHDSSAKHGRARTVVGIFILFGLIVPYVLARLVIMVEIFRTLCYLPPEAYKETWSGSFPRWG